MITLLQKFIDTKTAQYVEPVREGTAKGDPIGLSSIKYKSTLLFLTSLKGKEIAEAVGVSYGLLRVWRTEEAYLSAIARHETAFAAMVAKHIFESVVGTKAKGLSSNEIIHQFANDFADIALYSDRLITEVYKKVTSRSITQVNTFNTFFNYLCFIFSLRKDAPKPPAPVGYNVMKLTLFDILEAIQRPWTPDKEKAEQVKVSFLKAM
jgi:hypothetical protein